MRLRLPARRAVCRPAGLMLLLALTAGLLHPSGARPGTSLAPIARAQTEGIAVTAGALPEVGRTGGSIAIAAFVTSDTTRPALIDIEVRLPAGTKAFQQYQDNVDLPAGVQTAITATWQIPADAARGVVYVQIGVFTPAWGQLLHWEENALEFSVAAPGETPAALPPSGSGPRYPFVTLPPGADLPDGATCAAAVRRSTWEPRPANAAANAAVPQGMTLPSWGDMAPMASERLLPRVDGAFTGTTDEIIQWAACKWGFDVDTVRAVASMESAWQQSLVGDGGESFGLLQVKRTAHPGTYPWSERSTAFNVDYALAWRRACYEGDFVWIDADTSGDEWGCIGLWYSGRWNDPDALDYIARVRQRLKDRVWLSEVS